MPPQQEPVSHSPSSDLDGSTTSPAEPSAGRQDETQLAANGSGTAKTPHKPKASKKKRRASPIAQSAGSNGSDQLPQSADGPPAPTSASETSASIDDPAPPASGEPADPAGEVEAAGQGGSKSTSLAAGTIQVVMLPVSEIDANDYNSNENTTEEQNAYTAAAKRAGCLPKPVVARKVGDRYVTVDGQHGLIAAKALGWTEVPCQIVKCDELEAMRQSDERNRHGHINLVKHGRMLRRYRTLSGLSLREMAPVFGISEGTIRNRIHYAAAGDVRKDYASYGDTLIARLTVEQVRCYMEMGKDERDRWLDAGANMDDCPQKLKIPQKSLDEAVTQSDATCIPEHHDASAAVESIARRQNAAGGAEPASEALETHQDVEAQAARAPANSADPKAEEASRMVRWCKDAKSKMEKADALLRQVKSEAKAMQSHLQSQQREDLETQWTKTSDFTRQPLMEPNGKEVVTDEAGMNPAC